MKKKEMFMFYFIIALGAISAIFSAFSGDIPLLGMTVALVGVTLFGMVTAQTYAYKNDLNTDIIQKYKEAIELYEQLSKEYETRIKMSDDDYYAQRLLNLKQYVHIIFLSQALKEFALPDNDKSLIYANRWLLKRDEVLRTIDDTPNNNTPEVINEMFDSIKRLSEDIDNGKLNIER